MSMSSDSLSLTERDEVQHYFRDFSWTCYERIGGVPSPGAGIKAALLGLAEPLAEALLRVLQVRGFVDDVMCEEP